jgi:hypothetical protein
MPGRRLPPLPPSLPCTPGAHRSSPPPLVAGRRLRPSPLLLYPLNQFPSFLSLSPTKSRPEWLPETRDRVSPASLRRSGRHRRPPSAAQARSPPLAVGSRSNGSDPPNPAGQLVRYRSTRALLQFNPLSFPKSTRTPPQFKSNCGSVLILLFRPL